MREFPQYREKFRLDLRADRAPSCRSAWSRRVRRDAVGWSAMPEAPGVVARQLLFMPLDKRYCPQSPAVAEALSADEEGMT